MKHLLALTGLLLVAACDGRDDPGTSAAWTGQADQAFAEGDRLAAEAASTPEAITAWRRAGAGYLKAFRLEDPVEERREARAMLAFRIGRSWSKAARLGSDPRQRGMQADRALFWFAHARRIEPALHPVLFERALLLDSDIDDVRDPTRARASYESYVAAVAEAGSDVTASEAERVAKAQERIKVLAKPR